MSTISNTITHGITLGLAGYTSPLTITSTGELDTGTATSIYTPGAYGDAVLINQGTITGAGVAFGDGGSINNAGVIYGGRQR